VEDYLFPRKELPKANIEDEKGTNKRRKKKKVDIQLINSPQAT
jgi:hypothetical protein